MAENAVGRLGNEGHGDVGGRNENEACPEWQAEKERKYTAAPRPGPGGAWSPVAGNQTEMG